VNPERATLLERYALEVAVVCCCGPQPITNAMIDRVLRKLRAGEHPKKTITDREMRWMRARVKEALDREEPPPPLVVVAGGLSPSAIERVQQRFKASRRATSGPQPDHPPTPDAS
jgi:hypothetical protein